MSTALTISTDRTEMVLNILTALVEALHSAIPLTKKARSRDSSSMIPGWKDHVEPFCQDSFFWHSVWLSADKPISGQLFHLMCWARNKYQAQKQADNIMAVNLMEASKESDIDLLKEMKMVTV